MYSLSTCDCKRYGYMHRTNKPNHTIKNQGSYQIPQEFFLPENTAMITRHHAALVILCTLILCSTLGPSDPGSHHDDLPWCLHRCHTPRHPDEKVTGLSDKYCCMEGYPVQQCHTHTNNMLVASCPLWVYFFIRRTSG